MLRPTLRYLEHLKVRGYLGDVRIGRRRIIIKLIFFKKKVQNCINWFRLVLDTFQRKAFVNKFMNLGLPQKAGDLWTSSSGHKLLKKGSASYLRVSGFGKHISTLVFAIMLQSVSPLAESCLRCILCKSWKVNAGTTRNERSISIKDEEISC